MSFSAAASERRDRDKNKQLLTEHVQADFLGLLAGLVLGDAGVISFVHLPDVFDDQLRAVLVQAVLLARLKDDVVAVERQKQTETSQRRRRDLLLSRVFLGRSGDVGLGSFLSGK